MSPSAPLYVSLGSSMAAGPGITPVANRAAGRSLRNYPNLVAERCGYRLVDATVSGATTANILDTAQKGLGATFAPQIEQVHDEAALVTITVGGNDLNYVGSLMSLSILAPLARVPHRLKPHRLDPGLVRTEQDYAQTEASMVTVVEAVRARAPKARVLLVDYLTLVGSHEPSLRSLPLRAAERQAARELATRLAECFTGAARSTGVELVEASAASVDHGIGSPEPWVTGFDFGNPLRRQLKVPYHPRARGMAAVADLIVDVLT
jgi:lysophospholipase L1-like esterase